MEQQKHEMEQQKREMEQLLAEERQQHAQEKVQLEAEKAELLAKQKSSQQGTGASHRAQAGSNSPLSRSRSHGHSRLWSKSAVLSPTKNHADQ
jgi:hypothetical protein